MTLTLPFIVPVTVIFAILLFIFKELLEFIRRYKSDARKRSALRVILARECELNHWTLKSIRHIVNDIVEQRSLDSSTMYTLHYSRSGDIQFRYMRPGSRGFGGSGLAPTYRELMMKHILDVATLDRKLFLALEPAIEAVNELEHLRKSIMRFLDPDDPDQLIHLFEGFTTYALRELDDSYKALNYFYYECTGKKLEKHRLR